ncbi:MAG: TPM domain-containing protein, partial [Elusimicrobiota bacterium]|nr:TPM domain-containing protein [Elusimicrobiota bacterium]
MKKKTLFVLFSLLFAARFCPLHGSGLPKPAGWVADYAGVIDASSYQRMDAVIQELEQKTGAEIAVVTIKNTGNDSIDDFSVKLFKEWG